MSTQFKSVQSNWTEIDDRNRLPWNPNRLTIRFIGTHRISLVAGCAMAKGLCGCRDLGDVFKKLFTDKNYVNYVLTAKWLTIRRGYQIKLISSKVSIIFA